MAATHSSQLIDVQEGVGVAGDSVAEAVPLPEQTAPPDHLGGLPGQLQVPLITEHLPPTAQRQSWRVTPGPQSSPYPSALISDSMFLTRDGKSLQIVSLSGTSLNDVSMCMYAPLVYVTM